ncbi:MAG: Gfo/Idh/MocA family oxidoreductase, partial [Bacteroidetes bacterium]|nr:Gfo/Idh/MocA family oxidoreductase [Bacteroidota bacterium]
MSKVLNFGILGAGKIANRFTDAFRYVEGAVVLAAASREQKKAREFADKHQIRKAYGSYQELIHDPEIDIIYVATPHPFHHEHTLLCLN